jgi:citrate lyase beta subunit
VKHHRYNKQFEFVVDPVEFDKYSDKNLLQYCLGATMYMPGTTDFASAIMNKKYPGLTSFVLCFEDACKPQDVPAAESNALKLLTTLSDAIEDHRFDYSDLPLLFLRVRSLEQFKNFSSKLNPRIVKLIAGFNFPKFYSENGEAYFHHLEKLNREFDDILYGMPILEDASVAYLETRINELMGIKRILDKYRDLVLNVRVGGTDFSACFGVRRGIDYTIYDIVTVRDCLTDILNVFSRENMYTVSGPVWEYFRASKEMRWGELPAFDFTKALIKKDTIVNDAIDGLLRELVLDKANGFIGKTIIHPTHLNYVNGMYAVTKEEYDDALQIVGSTGGVVKSMSYNKMNETKPHMNWAERVLYTAKAYGVIKDQSEYIKLFS